MFIHLVFWIQNGMMITYYEYWSTIFDMCGLNITYSLQVTIK